MDIKDTSKYTLRSGQRFCIQYYMDMKCVTEEEKKILKQALDIINNVREKITKSKANFEYHNNEEYKKLYIKNTKKWHDKYKQDPVWVAKHNYENRLRYRYKKYIKEGKDIKTDTELYMFVMNKKWVIPEPQ